MAKVPQATSRTSRPIAWRWNRYRRKADARVTRRGSCLRVLRGFLEGPLGDSEGLRRNADPATIESCHCDCEALVQLSQQIVSGNPTAIEAECDRVARANSHLVLLL